MRGVTSTKQLCEPAYEGDYRIEDVTAGKYKEHNHQAPVLSEQLSQHCENFN